MVSVRIPLTALASAIRRAPHWTMVAFRQARRMGRKRPKARCQTFPCMTQSLAVKRTTSDKDGSTPTERTFTTIERGEGSPILLLHGLMGAAKNWRPVLQNLSPDSHSIALDIPFFQEGIKLNTIPAIVDYVRDYIEHMDLKQLLVAGNSLGGHVGLHLAMAIPERIAGLVLTGSSGLYEREMGRPQGANPSRQWYYEKMCEIFYDPIMVTDEMVDDVQAILSGRQCKRVLVSIAKSAKRDNLADRLGEVQCPVLLVWGKQDNVTPPDVADEFNSLLPNSELAWLDKCGHTPMLEHPAVFAKTMSKWWRRIGMKRMVAGGESRP